MKVPHPDIRIIGATSCSLGRDHLGSIRTAADAGNVLQQRARYGNFGLRTLNFQGSGCTGEDRAFLGERFEAEPSLMDLNARWYDPIAGLFLSADILDPVDTATAQRGDPVGWLANPVGTNRYAYAGQDPINKKDPGGHAIDRSGDTAKALAMLGGQVSRSVTIVAGRAGTSPIMSDQPTTNRLAYRVRNIPWAEERDIGGGGGGASGAVGLGAGVSLGAWLKSFIYNQETKEEDEVQHPGGEVTARPDFPAQSGGRSGQRVKDAKGPPNSAIPSTGGSVWITDEKGNVVVDVTRERAKPVIPGVGFGEKRPPTQGELDLYDQIRGRRE